MSSPTTLHELAGWARQVGLGKLLAQRYETVLNQLSVTEEDEHLVRALCSLLHVRTMDRAIGDPRADAMVARVASPAAVARLVKNLTTALGDFADVDLDDDDDDGDSIRGAQLPVFDSLEPLRAPSPRDLLPRMVSIAAAIRDVASARRWAAEHGVLERLSDPIAVLAARLYGGDPFMGGILYDPDKRVVDAFAPPPPPPPSASRWVANARIHSADTLATAARHYLQEVATAQAAVLARREALDGRAQPPSEPVLVALVEGLLALRAQLASGVKPRPIGTYDARPVVVEEAPLRIVYTEGADPRFGRSQVRAEIAVETEPLRVRCGCHEAVKGPCPHALSAVDAALDLLRDPAGPRGKLAAVLATPVWQRFLHAFGDELVRREGPAPSDDTRLAWRILGDGRVLAIEPLLQKRLKGGGFSQGGRVRVEDVLARRDLLTDPRDARAADVLGSGLDEPVGTARAPLVRRGPIRALEALIGHPRVFLDGRPGMPARVTRERLRVALEPGDAAVLVSFFVGARRYDAAELLALADGAEQVVSVDAAHDAVALCSLDMRAQALLAAFAKHPARFPRRATTIWCAAWLRSRRASS